MPYLLPLRSSYLLVLTVFIAAYLYSVPARATDAGGLSSLELDASGAGTRSFGQSHKSWNRYAGAMFLSGGPAKEFDFDGYGGRFIFDYMVQEHVSIGAHTGLFQSSDSEIDATAWYLGVRGSYHLLEAKFRKRESPWNIYAGMSLDLEVGGVEKDWHDKRVYFDLHAGLRYRLSSSWFVWSEIGLNNLTVGVSCAL